MKEQSIYLEALLGFNIEACDVPDKKYDEAFMGLSQDYVMIYDIDKLHELGYDSNIDGDFNNVIFAVKCNKSNVPTGSIVLEPTGSLSEAIVATVNGVTKVIYDYEKLLDAFIDSNDGWTVTDAEEWISYNTIRALPYMGANSPIIMFNIDYMV